MQSHRTYTAIVWAAEEGGYWAEVAELPGCVSQGETQAELADNINEAIEAYLAVATEVPKDAPEVMKVDVLVGAAD